MCSEMCAVLEIWNLGPDQHVSAMAAVAAVKHAYDSCAALQHFTGDQTFEICHYSTGVFGQCMISDMYPVMNTVCSTATNAAQEMGVPVTAMATIAPVNAQQVTLWVDSDKNTTITHAERTYNVRLDGNSIALGLYFPRCTVLHGFVFYNKPALGMHTPQPVLTLFDVSKLDGVDMRTQDAGLRYRAVQDMFGNAWFNRQVEATRRFCNFLKACVSLPHMQGHFPHELAELGHLLHEEVKHALALEAVGTLNQLMQDVIFLVDHTTHDAMELHELSKRMHRKLFKGLWDHRTRIKSTMAYKGMKDRQIPDHIHVHPVATLQECTTRSFDPRGKWYTQFEMGDICLLPRVLNHHSAQELNALEI